MAGLADLATASALANAIDGMRFDTHITSFDFKPSLGIVAKKLQQFGDELSDMTDPLTKSVEDVMTISILENFMSGGRPSWDSLSENTMAKRMQEGTGTMILVRSGSLAEEASSAGIWSIGKTTATVRSLPKNVWYGNIHQAGYAGSAYSGGNWFKKYQDAASKALGPGAHKKDVEKLALQIFDKRTASHGAAPRGAPAIPARRFIMFQDEDIDAIQIIFTEWVEDKVREAGLR